MTKLPQTLCGMLTSKTSVTKALLKERDKDKRREAGRLTFRLSCRAGFSNFGFRKTVMPARSTSAVGSTASLWFSLIRWGSEASYGWRSALTPRAHS